MSERPVRGPVGSLKPIWPTKMPASPLLLRLSHWWSGLIKFSVNEEEWQTQKQTTRLNW